MVKRVLKAVGFRREDTGSALPAYGYCNTVRAESAQFSETRSRKTPQYAVTKPLITFVNDGERLKSDKRV